MAEPMPVPLPVTEKTFTAYSKEQGQIYAAVRREYHPSVYETIIARHTSTGGQLDLLLDVGCGPGTATSGLAKSFAHAIGLDPSEGMMATARSSSVGKTATGEPIQFEVSTAESLGSNLSPPIADSSVDLITAANAAHWFNMDGFWRAAARVLKPGGSVALWTSGPPVPHPSMPAAAAIQAAIDRNLEEEMQPFRVHGNDLVRGRYADLPLPWSLTPPVDAFDKDMFFRRDWDIDEKFFIGPTEVSLDAWEKAMSTGSATTRWREAHPDAVGTEQDVVRKLRREIERLLHEAGVEKGKEKVRGGFEGVVLVAKKKA